jgi:hypothetical protein
MDRSSVRTHYHSNRRPRRPTAANGRAPRPRRGATGQVASLTRHARAAASAPTRLRLLCPTRNYSRDRTRTSPARITRPGGGGDKGNGEPDAPSCRLHSTLALRITIIVGAPGTTIRPHLRGCEGRKSQLDVAGGTWNQPKLTDESYQQQRSPQTCQRPSSNISIATKTIIELRSDRSRRAAENGTDSRACKPRKEKEQSVLFDRAPFMTKTASAVAPLLRLTKIDSRV